MGSYADRLKSLGKVWSMTKKAEQFRNIPEGRYQAEIKSVKLIEVKGGKRKGDPTIEMKMVVQAGAYKAYPVRKVYWIAAFIKAGDRKGQSVGLSQLKADVETLGLNNPKVFNEKTAAKLFEEMTGCVVEINVVENKAGYTNVYIDRAIDATSEDEDTDDGDDEDTDGKAKAADDSEDAEDSEEDAETDDDETESSDDDETSEDEDSEDDDEDEDSADEDSEDAEEKPVKRGPGRPKKTENEKAITKEKAKDKKKGKTDNDDEDFWDEAVDGK